MVTATEALPPLDNVVGVTTANMAVEKGDFIRAVIRARRKAVEFMHKNPDEAGDIVAKHYNLEPEVARSAVRNLTSSKTQGIPYWGSGQIHMDGLKRHDRAAARARHDQGRGRLRPRSSTLSFLRTTSKH